MRFTEQLRALDDAELDVYQFRVMMHVWRVGKCWESVRTTAQKCKMSVGKVSQVINELIDAGHLQRVVASNGRVAVSINVNNDRSPDEQLQQLERSPDEQRSPHEQQCSPHEQDEITLPLEKCSPHEPKINEPIEVEAEPLQVLERHFEQYAGILAGRSNYTEDWERPLQIILNGTDVETAKKKITHAVDFIRASKGTNKPYTLRAPLSLLTIIANMTPDTGVPQNTIRVRTR